MVCLGGASLSLEREPGVASELATVVATCFAGRERERFGQRTSRVVGVRPSTTWPAESNPQAQRRHVKADWRAAGRPACRSGDGVRVTHQAAASTRWEWSGRGRTRGPEEPAPRACARSNTAQPILGAGWPHLGECTLAVPAGALLVTHERGEGARRDARGRYLANVARARSPPGASALTDPLSRIARSLEAVEPPSDRGAVRESPLGTVPQFCPVRVPEPVPVLDPPELGREREIAYRHGHAHAYD